MYKRLLIHQNGKKCDDSSRVGPVPAPGRPYHPERVLPSSCPLHRRRNHRRQRPSQGPRRSRHTHRRGHHNLNQRRRLEFIKDLSASQMRLVGTYVYSVGRYRTYLHITFFLQIQNCIIIICRWPDATIKIITLNIPPLKKKIWTIGSNCF